VFPTAAISQPCRAGSTGASRPKPRPKYFTDRWAGACGAAKVPVIALHDARHTSATTGADAGVPEHVMQKRLGHADARTTREVYTHVLPESERKAAEIMEAILRHDAA
jgi:integrase